MCAFAAQLPRRDTLCAWICDRGKLARSLPAAGGQTAPYRRGLRFAYGAGVRAARQGVGYKINLVDTLLGRRIIMDLA